jgi:hypothetical protein
MARTYGHPDSTRTSQPSQHRNTLRVQDALRAISKGFGGASIIINKDDFLDFLGSFDRLYRVEGVIGQRLSEWLADHEDEIASWEADINQMQPGFFRTQAEDEAEGVTLMPKGEYVTRTSRGLPESYVDDGHSAKKPRTKRDLDLGFDSGNVKREGRTRPSVGLRANSSARRLDFSDEEPYGQPLDHKTTSKYPKFAGLSTEQLLSRTAKAAQNDMETVRDWFKQQRRVLDPSDPLVAKFKRLENELPRYDLFVGIAEEVAKAAKAKDKETAKHALINGDGHGSRFLATPSQSNRSATGNAVGDADEDEEYGGGYSAVDDDTPSKAPPSAKARKLKTSESFSSIEPSHLSSQKKTRRTPLVQSTRKKNQPTIKRSPSTAPSGVGSISDLSELTSEPSMPSAPSQRGRSSEVSRSRGRDESMEDVTGADDPEDSYKPGSSAKRKRKQSKRAIESREAVSVD